MGRFIAAILLMLLCGMAVAVGSGTTTKKTGESAKASHAQKRVKYDPKIVKSKKGLVYLNGEAKPFTGVIYDTYENGNIKYETPLIKGKRGGIAVNYYESGNKELTARYSKSGKAITYTYWRENGTKRMRITRVDKDVKGKIVYWDSRGKKLSNFKGRKVHLPKAKSKITRRLGRSLAMSKQFCIVTGLEGEGTKSVYYSSYVYDCKSGKANNAKVLLKDKLPSIYGFVRASPVVVHKNLAFLTMVQDVHILRYDGKRWKVEARLSPPVPKDPYESFGRTLATNGRILAVSATSQKKIYLYHYKDSKWEYGSAITSPSVDVEDFGDTMAMDGNNLLVGSRKGKAVYLYAIDNSKAKLVSTIKPENEKRERKFGEGVALSGNVALVGSREGECGTVHVYRRSLKENKWTQEAALSETPCSNSSYGENLDVQGDTLVVGQTGDREQGYDSGAVFVYKHKGNQWDLFTKLKAPKPVKEQNFGYDVALVNNKVLVSAWGISGFSVSTSGLKPFTKFSGSSYIFNLGK